MAFSPLFEEEMLCNVDKNLKTEPITLLLVNGDLNTLQLTLDFTGSHQQLFSNSNLIKSARRKKNKFNRAEDPQIEESREKEAEYTQVAADCHEECTAP